MKVFTSHNVARAILCCATFLFCMASCQQSASIPEPAEIDKLIEQGDYNIAREAINQVLATEQVSNAERLQWQWKLDWMHRMELDFTKTEADAREYIGKYYPQLSDSMIQNWEKTRALEGMMLNGEKRYFSRGLRNLFRIDKNAKILFEQANGHSIDPADRMLWDYIPKVAAEVKKTGKTLVCPQRMHIKYSISVPEGIVPEGELLRVWMPLPRTDVSRHKDFRLIATSEPNYIISPDTYVHKSLYMEAPARKGEPTVFECEYEFTSMAELNEFDPESLKPYDTEDALYKEYTAESLPHIVKSPKIKALADSLAGEETNAYRKVQRFYEYILTSYPWAGAREYSTIDCIPHYVLDNGHGDCGQVGLLMISLCRAAGIPARWQSGWMLHPGAVNLHDWTEVWYPELGWIPTDPSFGRTEWPDENYKNTNPQSYWFFSHGIDAYRLIANTDISGAFFPAKIFPRSETIDFQRGELEWRGGNLYFDCWDYNMDLKYL